MEANTQSKKEIQNYIKQELASILISVNPAIDKRDFKKSIKKAAKVLFAGATRKRKKSRPVETGLSEEVTQVIVS